MRSPRSPPSRTGRSRARRWCDQGGYYYLFASKGLCCQRVYTEDTYEQIVGRSTSPHGPFADEAGQDMMGGGGTVLIASTTDWNAPGGGTAHIDASSGESLLVFHAAEMGPNPAAYLWVKQITWTNGWPVLGPVQ